MCFIIPFVLVLWGCSGAAGNFPSGSYERGVAEFEAEHYFEAVEDLKLFVRRNPTDPKVDEAQYHIALARFRDKDYPVAAVEFEILRSDYPQSARVDDAWYMEGVCYQRQAPSLEHDQTLTRRALEHFQRYLLQFPDGTRHDDAAKQAAELQEQLDRKRLEAVTLYERLGKDRAALVTLQALLDERLDSTLRPGMLDLAGTLALRLGETEEARKFWETLVASAPESDSAEHATKELEKLGREENGSSR